jgi:hypothetical protein
VQEWTQLRRSFRYDEYNKIAAANPPQGPLGKVSSTLGRCVLLLVICEHGSSATFMVTGVVLGLVPATLNFAPLLTM